MDARYCWLRPLTIVGHVVAIGRRVRENRGMRSRRAIMSLLVGVLILFTGCGDSTPELELDDEQLIQQIGTWTNQMGLLQTDPDVWRQRLARACDEGVWDPEVAVTLAEEFIDEDMPLSVRAGGDTPWAGDGAQALWVMAVNTCRDAFPDGEIEKGPPFFGG